MTRTLSGLTIGLLGTITAGSAHAHGSPFVAGAVGAGIAYVLIGIVVVAILAAIVVIAWLCGDRARSGAPPLGPTLWDGDEDRGGLRRVSSIGALDRPHERAGEEVVLFGYFRTKAEACSQALAPIPRDRNSVEPAPHAR